MIKSLRTEDLGLSPEMYVEWAPRLNLITGDNGLGKSFLLDLSWFALTKTWAWHPIIPHSGRRIGTLEFEIDGGGEALQHRALIALNGEDAMLDLGRPTTKNVVVYVRVDGGLSVWDPLRNGELGAKTSPEAFNFNGNDIWDGLKNGEVDVCEGLERDWVSWQKGNEPQFATLTKVLEELSPPNEPIVPGIPRRVFLGEGRDRPTIQFAEQIVPVVHASSGMRRILSVAYALVWAWYEHTFAAKLLNQPVGPGMVVLFEEVENHLHPKWQRKILPSLLKVISSLRGPNFRTPQMLVTTHAPLVLASVEPFFSRESDDLIHLDLRDGQVVLEQGFWTKEGDTTNWLVSETFGLKQARNLPAERAIEAAEAFMRGDLAALPEELDTEEKIDADLRRLLPSHDEFWPRWPHETGALRD